MQITYREDGSKEEETPYVEGKLHGTEVDYHRWGDKWRETPYVNGKEHGMQVRYRGDGSVEKVTLMKTVTVTVWKFGTSRTVRALRKPLLWTGIPMAW